MKYLNIILAILARIGLGFFIIISCGLVVAGIVWMASKLPIGEVIAIVILALVCYTIGNDVLSPSEELDEIQQQIIDNP